MVIKILISVRSWHLAHIRDHGILWSNLTCHHEDQAVTTRYVIGEYSRILTLTRLRRSLASRTLKRLFGSGSRKPITIFRRRQNFAAWETLIHPLGASHCFPIKFIMQSFEYYSGATNPIQHLWQFQDKMAVHSHDDLHLSHVFPYNLKGAVYDWFYSLPRYLL